MSRVGGKGVVLAGGGEAHGFEAIAARGLAGSEGKAGDFLAGFAGYLELKHGLVIQSGEENAVRVAHFSCGRHCMRNECCKAC